ncbi:HK97 gp10 family phage protein [Lactiplantibacillus paraplantarum]|nr:HK97 gp10 family phage protein [Lactiplantibacillus paraplantarum]KRL51354.1 hypothetical protein FD48_GL000034 [Lactiplantibacillus paraplantarum DSM 10667]MCU4683970.1 HK97 gp10 family phage protein [Lactiplantibacillus paraplantarum]MDL2061094.1 HK97 gp10 family phage protein [Lactiplantibacillus paraplantarum]QJU49204.1 hypothetical protein CK401_00009 [Lactiplantibacillus paraplantarum]RKD24885.1 hypothetical protein BG617_13515 [Lactiplantibacillus paraplantarum]
MSWGTIDDAEFKEFAKKVQTEANAEILKSQLEESVKRVGAQILKGVKAKTPVDTGTLRRGWELKGPTVSASVITLTALNNIEYAQYIEMGHRTRGGGWVPGQHMLMKTMFEVDDQMTSLLTPALQKFLSKLS